MRKKTYEFSWSGYYEMLHDIKQKKIDRINKIITLVLVGIMFGTGVIGAPVTGVILTNMGINAMLDYIL